MKDASGCRNPFYSGRFFHSELVGLSEPRTSQKSQSLLFRSVFPFYEDYENRSGGIEVAIPSIQVGFSIQSGGGWTSTGSAFSRNPFYSGRFFHSPEIVSELNRNQEKVAIPSIQVGFSILLSNKEAFIAAYSRNPFYSGRFFHSLRRFVVKQGSLSVAIPSIQVGFSIQRNSACPLSREGGSQSLLFRSVFPFLGCRTRYFPSTARSRNPFYSGRFFHSGTDFTSRS